MSVNERIIGALEPLGLPVVPDLYTGDEDRWITFHHGSRGALFGDDGPGAEIRTVQVHLYVPCGINTLTLRRGIKRRLLAAGFTWPAETDAGTDTWAGIERQHIVFECEIEEGVDEIGADQL